MSKVKYNWATYGCGVIGNQLAQAMQALGGSLYSVGNRTHSKAVEFAQRYGISKVYRSFLISSGISAYTEIVSPLRGFSTIK